jgi:hypothetical protein
MNALVDAVAASIVDEVANADTWDLKKADPMWRNPREGKVLHVFHGGDRQGQARWTGGTVDIVEIVVEYAEPAPENARNLQHDETGEYNANAEALKLRQWALAHEAGFSGITHKFDWTRTDYTPNVRRELFTRYCRLTFEAEVVRSFA